ncbi:MBL fold metallo-hydrolase [Stenotrophomonas rhizophila]|uniref:MBL fold metallo-hydrolase n=1 Tax=Stenotrophomonas rhizophila TaxID=216778 RepID=UPI001E358EDE|nr:MBL fold metallo-hydrolase [Stenotrophomonas rhizophila]MCC7635367.1 MBL fold metallo-hydrolase [Stenotrophomonas rhizophila]MCC7664404.1 MBL fold metallo-hydrolase [Stenotrophomonas rhizophila]
MSGHQPDGARMGRRVFLSSLAAGATAALLPVSQATARPSSDVLRIQRLAWAGIRLQLPGSTLFIDPLTNAGEWGSALPDVLVPVGGGEGDTTVLLTHVHSDHFDAGAVAQSLRNGGSLIHPAGTHPLPVPAGARARPAPLWEPQLLGDFTATAVPASDGYGDTQVSWVVSAAGRRIFHGGDTMWHGHWWKIARQFGPFDAAFLPINGARFGWRKPVSGEPGVLTPGQAIAAATILGARFVVPIHYGISGVDEYREVDDPLGALARVARGTSIEVQPVQPGAWVTWR